jgi:hypothetical protein
MNALTSLIMMLFTQSCRIDVTAYTFVEIDANNSNGIIATRKNGLVLVINLAAPKNVQALYCMWVSEF